MLLEVSLKPKTSHFKTTVQPSKMLSLVSTVCEKLTDISLSCFNGMAHCFLAILYFEMSSVDQRRSVFMPLQDDDVPLGQSHR